MRDGKPSEAAMIKVCSISSGGRDNMGEEEEEEAMMTKQRVIVDG